MSDSETQMWTVHSGQVKLDLYFFVPVYLVDMRWPQRWHHLCQVQRLHYHGSRSHTTFCSSFCLSETVMLARKKFWVDWLMGHQNHHTVMLLTDRSTVALLRKTVHHLHTVLRSFFSWYFTLGQNCMLTVDYAVVHWNFIDQFKVMLIQCC